MLADLSEEAMGPSLVTKETGRGCFATSTLAQYRTETERLIRFARQ